MGCKGFRKVLVFVECCRRQQQVGVGFDAVGGCTNQSSYNWESCNFLMSLYMEVRVPDSLSSGNCLGYSSLFVVLMLVFFPLVYPTAVILTIILHLTIVVLMVFIFIIAIITIVLVVVMFGASLLFDGFKATDDSGLIHF